MSYAQSTHVPASTTRAQIAALVQRHGAGAVAQFQESLPGGAERSAIAFRLGRAAFRFEVTTPPLEEFEFTPTGRSRSREKRASLRDQAHRQRWRALLLFVRAALEAVEQGAFRVEEALLPWAVVAGNRTIGAELVPRLLEGEAFDPARLLPKPAAEATR